MRSQTVICMCVWFLAALVYVGGIKHRKCGSKTVVDSPDVFVSNCAKLPCLLKRNKKTNVEYTFTPEFELKNPLNDVHAKIVGIPFPFIGVDGTSICQKIYDPTSGQKVQCPLAPGRNYTYKDSFDILNIYPKLKTLVHWAFKEKEKIIFCFEVPARIV